LETESVLQNKKPKNKDEHKPYSFDSSMGGNLGSRVKRRMALSLKSKRCSPTLDRVAQLGSCAPPHCWIFGG